MCVRARVYAALCCAQRLSTHHINHNKHQNTKTPKHQKKGVGTAEDIDKGLRLGTNQPMGPLRLADFIGSAVSCCCLCVRLLLRVLWGGW